MTEETKGALAKAAANLPAIDKDAMAAALTQSADEASTGTGEFDYLSFSGKTGRWAIGRDKVEPDPDAVYIVEPMMATEGWNCWKKGKPVAKHEWSLYERATKAVRAADLEDHGPYNEKAGEGWQFSLGIGLIDLGTERQVKFSTSSVSGRNVISDLNKMIAEDVMEGGDGIAVIQFDQETFEAQGQTNYKPVIDVLVMASRAEVGAFLSTDEYSVDDLIEGKVKVEGVDEAPEPEVEEPEEQKEEPKKGRRSSKPQEKASAPAASGSRRRRPAA